MDILIADEFDISDLTTVEIQSKRQSIPECIQDYEVDFSKRQNRWQTYFKGQSPETSKPKRIVLKAVIDNKIIGYIAGHLTTRYGMDAEIQSFYILLQYQRQGFGTSLLTKYLQWLIYNDSKSLCVGISPDNKYQEFYLKHYGQKLNEHWIYWTDIEKLLNTLKA